MRLPGFSTRAGSAAKTRGVDDQPGRLQATTVELILDLYFAVQREGSTRVKGR